jgi:hypothetical protein
MNHREKKKIGKADSALWCPSVLVVVFEFRLGPQGTKTQGGAHFPGNRFELLLARHDSRIDLRRRRNLP